MAYVITELCIGTKNTACVGACPVDCIYDAGDQFVINPAECIDCSMCMPECPVEAISTISANHPDGGRIVIVSHGGVMRAFLRDLFGPEVLPGAQRAANASITRLQWNEPEPRLLVVAATPHLAEAPGATTVE